MTQTPDELLRQWQENPDTVVCYEVPPDSGYWLFIKRDPGGFTIHSLVTYSTAKRKHQQIGGAHTLESAKNILQEQADRHLQYIEKRDAGLPTPTQLHFLFRHRVPIPLDLTFAEASELIEEKLDFLKAEQAEKRLRREREKQAKAEAAALKKQQYRERFPPGKRIKHHIFGLGTVTRNNGEFIEVLFDNTEIGKTSLSLEIVGEKLSDA